MYLVPSKIYAKRDNTNVESHISQRFKTVNRIGRSIAVSAFCITISACSVSNTVSTTDTSDSLVTASVTKPVESEGIASTDAELIKTVVADSETNRSLAWKNPDTGNKGTITAINDFIGENGQQCKKFQTTVDTFMGISLYNGETCELKKGFWVLSWFLREDN